MQQSLLRVAPVAMRGRRIDHAGAQHKQRIHTQAHTCSRVPQRGHLPPCTPRTHMCTHAQKHTRMPCTRTLSPFFRLLGMRPHNLRKVGSAAMRIQLMKRSSCFGDPCASKGGFQHAEGGHEEVSPRLSHSSQAGAPSHQSLPAPSLPAPLPQGSNSAHLRTLPCPHNLDPPAIMAGACGPE